MADTKKEHYVPQCYLKNFVNENERIAVFDKKLLQSRLQRTTDIAMENYFYDIDFDDLMNKINSVDKEKMQSDIKEIAGINNWDKINSILSDKKHIEKQFFCHIEAVYSQLLKNIISKSYNGNTWVINNCFSMSAEEKDLLSFFISIQIIRTKTFREELGQIIEKTYQALAYKSQMNDIDSLPKEAFEVKANEDFVKLQHSAMILDPEITIQMADVLSNHIWVMYVNKTSNLFYTSDNPITKIPHKSNQYMSYSGYNSEGIEILFPISPTLLLAMYEKTTFEKLYEDRKFLSITNIEDVDYFNKAQLASSFRCIFSKNNSFDLAKKLCQQYPQLTDNSNRVSVT